MKVPLSGIARINSLKTPSIQQPVEINQQQLWPPLKILIVLAFYTKARTAPTQLGLTARYQS